MRTRDLSLALLSTSCLFLTACGMTNQIETLEIKTPDKYLKENKVCQPQVAHAILLLKEEKYSEASAHINQNLQTQPKSVIFHLLNAITYEKMAENGDPTGQDLAIMGYEKALQLDPFNAFSMIQLGKIKYREQKYDEAQEYFANALLQKPNDPNIIHELAAASYYAFDIKTALAAIRKAAEIKPEDPLIHRAAVMIYAAAGDFKNAENHLKLFQDKVGQSPDVARVADRFNEWQQLYKAGRFKLAVARSSGEAGETVDVPVSGAFPEGPGGQGHQGVQMAIRPESETEEQPRKLQIVIDAYMIEIHEEASTSKGNNVLNTLAITLNPGSYIRFNGEASGSGLLHTPTGVTQLRGDAGNANGAGAVTDAAGKLVGTVSASTLSTTIANTGNFSGYLFTRGISWAGLLYSLNIANATDSRIELINRPTMVTSLNKESRFFSGTELANVSQGSIGSGLSRYQIGVQLTVHPQSLEGDLVTMDIALETSHSQDINPNILATVSVGKTRLETNVRVHLGETIMLGGIYKREELQSNSGVPGFKDLPIVQYFFANESTVSRRDSVALLITPRSPDIVKSAINRAMSQESVKPNVKELSVRNPDWFHPRPNAVNILNYINLDPTIYYEFRTGDILPPSWGYEPALSDKLAELSSFLYF